MESGYNLVPSADIILGTMSSCCDLQMQPIQVPLLPAIVQSIYLDEGCTEYSPYNWERSTEENFRSNHTALYGTFTSIREVLDYEYHSHYCSSRQLFQDTIIESLLPTDEPVLEDKDKCEQWIVFSAGVMGAGKTHTINELTSKKQESHLSWIRRPFVSVDPDEIRLLLPEFHQYVAKNPEEAGENTRKEAGMLAEILTEAALERGQNVLVDGSLRDAEWYVSYFKALRDSYPCLKLGIIHVTAPAEDIYERVERRAKATGRVVPADVLLESMERVPKSVEILRHHVDFFMEVDNAVN
eukprot:scaffold9825_cov203-Cylindrotheca_fusiformis.AAC.6